MIIIERHIFSETSMRGLNLNCLRCSSPFVKMICWWSTLLKITVWNSIRRRVEQFMVQFWVCRIHGLCWFDSRFHEHRTHHRSTCSSVEMFIPFREMRILLNFCVCLRCFCFNFLPWYISIKPPFGRIMWHFLTTSGKSKHQPSQ